MGWLVDTGYKYIHALGEICRVAEIVGLSAKLHKPWMLSGSVDPARLFALLNECYTIWSDSGLAEALLCVSNQNNVERAGISRELLESIKYIHELDEQELQSCVFTGDETTCQLAALPVGFIPSKCSIVLTVFKLQTTKFGLKYLHYQDFKWEGPRDSVV